MSAVAAEWLAVFIFFLLLAVIAAVEVFWIVKSRWTTSGKALIFVLASNLIGLGLGTFFVFAVFMATLMMAFGPSGQGSNAPDAAYWAAIAAALVVPPIFLILSKRVCLLILKIASGSRAWTYSLLSSVLILVFALVPPVALTYAIWYVLEWK